MLYQQLVIFTAKTSLEVFRLRQEHVWSFFVLGNCICEMKRVTVSGQQGVKTRDYLCCTSTLSETRTNRELNPKDHSQCWVPPIVAFYDQQGLLRAYFPKGQTPPWKPMGW